MKIMKIIAAIASLIAVSCGANANDNVTMADPAQFHDMISADSAATLIDARKHDEYSAGHLKGAMLINWLDTENFKQEAAKLDKSKTIYVYCRSGRRSNQAANWLASQGFKVVDMAGGILAWEKAGLPIDTSVKP